MLSVGRSGKPCRVALDTAGGDATFAKITFSFMSNNMEELTMEKKIVTCKIEHGRWTNEVHAAFDDGSEGKVLEYYPDEISFTEDELIGLTMMQAYELKRQKDIRYIQS